MIGLQSMECNRTPLTHATICTGFTGSHVAPHISTSITASYWRPSILGVNRQGSLRSRLPERIGGQSDRAYPCSAQSLPRIRGEIWHRVVVIAPIMRNYMYWVTECLKQVVRWVCHKQVRIEWIEFGVEDRNLAVVCREEHEVLHD